MTLSTRRASPTTDITIMGPISTETLKVIPFHPQPAGMVYISDESLQALVQLQTQNESQLAQLVQQLRPWVSKAISESEKQMIESYQATLDQQVRLRHGQVDTLQRRVEERFQTSQTLNFSSFREEIQQLQEEMAATLTLT